MKEKIIVIILATLFGISLWPIQSTGEYAYYNYPDSQENPVSVHADGYIISVDTENPGVIFHSFDKNITVFSVQYMALYGYSGNISDYTYMANLSDSRWVSTVSNLTEEDGTTRTVVKMSSWVDMISADSTISNWGKIEFEFLILVRGEEAQLGISIKLTDIKVINSISHIGLVQSIYADKEIYADSNKIYVSGVYYRWDSNAVINGVNRVSVSSFYSNGNLYLIYPYDPDVREISHYSGRVDIGGLVVIRDLMGEYIGYSLGILLGTLLLGIPYAIHRKNEKSPFDMDSPLYKK